MERAVDKTLEGVGKSQARHQWSALSVFFFFQAEDGIRDKLVTGVQTCALPICTSVTKRARPVLTCFLGAHPYHPQQSPRSRHCSSGCSCPMATAPPYPASWP